MERTRNLNRVVLIGRLMDNPRLHVLRSGCKVCRMRIAVNGARRNAVTGDCNEQAGCFDVTVFGSNAERAARALRRGRSVAIDGRLEWHEWKSRNRHSLQAVNIVADRVELLGGATEELSGTVTAMPVARVAETADDGAAPSGPGLDKTNEVSRYELELRADLEECESWLAVSSDIDWPWQSADQAVEAK